MMQPRHLALVVLLAGSTIACGAGAPADEPADHVAPAPAAETAADARAATSAEGERPLLTEALVERWIEAARAVETAKAADPQLEELATMRGDISIVENAAAWDRTPALRAAVQGAGLSTREYLAIGAEIVGAFLAEATIGEEALKREPEVTQRNVAFVRAHQERIQQAMADMRAGE